MAKIICLNCFIGYAPEYCELELSTGCITVEGEVSLFDESFDSTDGTETEESKEYKDAISTGRKRAARLYPITPGMVCEWAWHKQCGGGIEPIIGCTGRPSSNIHHGPDKSTLNNERDNISIICTFCHNRWHTANDRYYVEPRPLNATPWLQTKDVGERKVYALSDMVKATKQEILMNEMMIPEGGKDK